MSTKKRDHETISHRVAVLGVLSACAVDNQPYEPQSEKQCPFEALLDQRVEDVTSAAATRTYVADEDGVFQIHWTEGDAVSIFFSTYNEKYLFAGSTGDTAGRLDAAQAGGLGSSFTTGFEVERYYAVYPYAEGTVTDMGAVSIRGRGNSTWGYPKKPYALKFDKKTALLGMPADKRWNLLANYLDRTRMRNDIALELGRRLPGLRWTPKGDFVELVLNGVHLGNYYLCEHIKIAEDRVNIQEMKAKDVSYETGSITGGYLLEMSLEYDEVNKFLTNPFPDLYYQAQYLHGGPGGTYRLPVMVKSPEEDVMVPEQLEYITGFINGVQDRIVGGDATWMNDVDIDSFIEWMLVQEVVGNNEPVHPKSSYMYKDRNVALVMGPLWDFDYHTFTSDYSVGTVYKYSLWYGYMLRYPDFARRVKTLWPEVKAAFLDVRNDYIPPKAFSIMNSVDADLRIWPMTTSINGDEGQDFVTAVSWAMNNLRDRVGEMDTVISNIPAN